MRFCAYTPKRTIKILRIYSRDQSRVKLEHMGLRAKLFKSKNDVYSQLFQAEGTAGKRHFLPIPLSIDGTGISEEEIAACNKEVETVVQQQNVRQVKQYYSYTSQQ